MAIQDMVVSRFLYDIVPIANSAMGEDDIISNFSKSVSTLFGIDKVSFTDLKKRQGGTMGSLEDYIRNTKKTFVDNQLSEYSSFPELIRYKNGGYRSCAVMPLMAEGKVVSLIEMLSQSENKFSDDMLSSISFGASFIGFVLMYKSELVRSLRLATYFDAAFNNGMPQFIIDRDGTIVKLNRSAMRAFGASASESARITDTLALDMEKVKAIDAGIYADVIADRTNAGKVYAVSTSRINEKLVHVMANDATPTISYDTISGVVNRNKDVAFLLTDTSFAIRNASANTEKMFGYPTGILAAGNLLDIIIKQDQPDFKGAVGNMLSGNGQFASGSANLSFNESIKKYVHFTCTRFMDGLFFMLVDASIEKYIESAKRDLSDFISGSSDIVLSINKSGYIIDCNMPAETILGIKREALVGKEVRSLYADPVLLERDMTYANNNVKVDNTFVNVIANKDGADVQIPATHSIRILNSSKSDYGEVYLIILKEIATKRKLEDQEASLLLYQNMEKKLKSESDLKSQFIYNISHELKTPLTNIKGYSTLLHDEEFGKLTDEQKGYIKTTLVEADRLMLVIQQVLDAAKLDAKKVKLEYKEVDFQNMGNNPSIKALEESAKGKGIEFKWEVDFNVPRVQGDPNRLIQVFVNLIGNAIKFTEKGGIRVHIIRKNKGTVQCSVIDSGMGMSDDAKKKILRKNHRFFEAPQRGLVERPGTGTGLGLLITRDLVELHGGKISFESKAGEGSTFWFTIPVTPKPKKNKKE